MKDSHLFIMQIYEILKEHSSEEQPLSIQDLLNNMPSESDSWKPPNRKTMYSYLGQLQELADIGLLDNKLYSREEKGKATKYYTESHFYKAEVKLLCDAIASSRFISKAQSKGLIEKIGKPFGNDFVAKYGYLLDIKKPMEKSYNAALFESIEIISDAIEHKKMVSFQYLHYNLNKKLVPKYSEDNGFITVSPYYLIWTLDHYYLFCKLDNTGEERYLRMDKVKDVKQLEKQATPPPQNINLRDYSRNQAFMFGGEEERIKLRCQMRMLGQVIDFFGENAEINPIDGDYFEVQIVTSIDSIKYWVLQYITAIDEIRPAKLRTIIVDYLEDALQRNK